MRNQGLQAPLCLRLQPDATSPLGVRLVAALLGFVLKWACEPFIGCTSKIGDQRQRRRERSTIYTGQRKLALKLGYMSSCVKLRSVTQREQISLQVTWELIHESSAYLPSFMKSKMKLNKWAHLPLQTALHFWVKEGRRLGTYSWLCIGHRNRRS